MADLQHQIGIIFSFQLLQSLLRKALFDEQSYIRFGINSRIPFTTHG